MSFRVLVPYTCNRGDVDPFYVLVVEVHKVFPADAQPPALLSDFLHDTVFVAPTILHQHRNVATDVVGGHVSTDVVGLHHVSGSREHAQVWSRRQLDVGAGGRVGRRSGRMRERPCRGRGATYNEKESEFKCVSRGDTETEREIETETERVRVRERVRGCVRERGNAQSRRRRCQSLLRGSRARPLRLRIFLQPTLTSLEGVSQAARERVGGGHGEV